MLIPAPQKRTALRCAKAREDRLRSAVSKLWIVEWLQAPVRVISTQPLRHNRLVISMAPAAQRWSTARSALYSSEAWQGSWLPPPKGDATMSPKSRGHAAAPGRGRGEDGEVSARLTLSARARGNHGPVVAPGVGGVATSKRLVAVERLPKGGEQ